MTLPQCFSGRPIEAKCFSLSVRTTPHHGSAKGDLHSRGSLWRCGFSRRDRRLRVGATGHTSAPQPGRRNRRCRLQSDPENVVAVTVSSMSETRDMNRSSQRRRSQNGFLLNLNRRKQLFDPTTTMRRKLTIENPKRLYSIIPVTMNNEKAKVLKVKSGDHFFGDSKTQRSSHI